MKLFLQRLLLIAGLVHLVACSEPDAPNPPQNEPEHVNNEFVFENISAVHTAMSVSIRPVNKDMEYVVVLSEKKHFLMNNIDSREELLDDDNQYFAELAQGYGVSIYDFLKGVGWLTRGDKEKYEAINLYPNTEYVIYCYGVKFDGDSYEAITPVNYVVVKTTTPELLDVKFDVKSTVDGNAVSIDVDPGNYRGLYYYYIVPEDDRYYVYEDMEFPDEYVDYYRNKAFNEFNQLINANGIPAEEFCYSGVATIEQRLDPNKNFQIVLFAVSSDQTPLLRSIPTVSYFATEDVLRSDLRIDIKVTDITPYTAQLTVTPSNNTEQYACVFLARNQVPSYEDEYEQMMAIIADYYPAMFRGSWSEQLMPLMPNSEYTVLAFGVENNLPTTELFRYDFTSAAAQEGTIAVEGIDIVKLFDAEEIAALDSRYAYLVEECQCIGLVEMKTSAPTDSVYFWWYEDWMKYEYSEEAFLEDLLLYEPTERIQLINMYYDLPMLFAGIAEDSEGNMSPIYYTEVFTLSKEQCSPASEFFDLL